MINLAIAAFRGSGLVTKGLIVLGLLSALIATYAAWHHHVWRNGYDDAITAIAKQDKKVIAIAQKRRSLVRDCAAGGMQWDQSTGKCVRR